MSYLKCKNCGHFEAIKTSKYRTIGMGIGAFGVFGWFSFLFAGSGHAFLIAAGITLVGVYFFWNAKELSKNALLEKRCPKCQQLNWDPTPYDHVD